MTAVSSEEALGVATVHQEGERSYSDNLREQPAALRGEVWMTLHTRHAQRLFAGREVSAESHSILGLTRFGSILSQIFVCVLTDDPYADWWLVKVEEALEESASHIELLRQTIQAKLSSTPSIDIAIAASLQPIRVPLAFSNPYAFNAARLIVGFDGLARAILTARHVGVIDRDASERFLFMGARSVRRALVSAYGYKYCGLTRQDIRENNAKALVAHERMGDIPAPILEGTRVARFAPAKPTASVSVRRRPAMRMTEHEGVQTG